MYIVHSIASLRGQATSALLTQWYRERLYHVAQHYKRMHSLLPVLRCAARATLTPSTQGRPGKSRQDNARQTTRLNVSHCHAITNTTTSQHLYPNPKSVVSAAQHCRVSGAPHTLSLSWFIFHCAAAHGRNYTVCVGGK
jgi:hypothetical protein